MAGGAIETGTVPGDEYPGIAGCRPTELSEPSLRPAPVSNGSAASAWLPALVLLGVLTSVSNLGRFPSGFH